MNTTWKRHDPLRASMMREIVGLLLDHGADIDKTDDKLGETALMKATGRNYRDMALFLLERGADWRIRGLCKLTYHSVPIWSQLGETALHIAYIRNERSIACAIIDTHIRNENRGDAGKSLSNMLDDVRRMTRADLPVWSVMQSRLVWAHRRPFLLYLYQYGLLTLSSLLREHQEVLPLPQAQNGTLLSVLQNIDLVKSICAYL
jgi:hypothetical protein